MRFKGLTPFDEICFSCFTYTVTIRFNEFKRNKLHVSSAVIVTQKVFGYCGGLRAVSMIETKAPILFQPIPGQSSVITAVLLTSKDCFIRLSQKHKIVLYLQMFQQAKLYISASTLFLKYS